MTSPIGDNGSICIDLSAAAHERAGLGRYASALAEAMLARGVELTAFVNDPRGSQLRPPLSDLPLHTAHLSRKRWRLRAAASYVGGPALDRVMAGTTLFHATEHLLPRLTRARSVFTLHDIAYMVVPEYHLPRNRIYLRMMMPRFLRRADRIIAVSEYTRRDALRAYPSLAPEKFVVIPEGVEPRFRPDVDPDLVAGVRDRYSLPQRFILTVGTIEPRKNHTTLVEAFATVRTHHPEVGLVIAGGRGWLSDRFFDRVRALGLDDQVVFTGHVADEEMPALFKAAEVFAFPSEFEGFGLPPLEAMACGVPVVSSDAASLPEVLGDAGMSIAPRDVAGWVQVLDRLLNDAPLRASFAARGLERARLFSWDTAAERTSEVYRSVMAGARS
jgi:glycosyltransferase involved in cell wall biosynthesis